MVTELLLFALDESSDRVWSEERMYNFNVTSNNLKLHGTNIYPNKQTTKGILNILEYFTN